MNPSGLRTSENRRLTASGPPTGDHQKRALPYQNSWTDDTEDSILPAIDSDGELRQPNGSYDDNIQPSSQADSQIDPGVRNGGISNGYVAAQNSQPLHEIQEAPSVELPQASRPLNAKDVGALVLNKMVGSGIFTAPPTVLILTGSAKAAMGLWIGGFFYTLLSMFIYLQFARVLPHTGGEMIYLDETLPSPELLVYTAYAIYFVSLNNDATNAMQFANQVDISATWNGPNYSADGQEIIPNPSPKVDPRFMRFLAVVILSFVCLLHYFSAWLGRGVNKILAVFKLVSLLALLSLAARAVAENPNRGENFSRTTDSIPSYATSTAAAFLLVIFSFQGWENATFVADEIETYSILRNGFIGGVVVVGLLYITINALFLSAISFDDVSHFVHSGRGNYAPLFSHDSIRSNKIWAVVVAVSAAGNLVSKIYTEARVKQAIGRICLFPWSHFWGSESRFDSETPQGGLAMHWISSVVFIIISSSINNLNDAISFPGTLGAYWRGCVNVFIGCGFVLLNKRLESRTIPEPNPEDEDGDRSNWAIGSPPWFEFPSKTPTRIISGILYVLVGLYIVLSVLVPPYKNSDGTTMSVPGWAYGTILIGLLTFSMVYWLAVVPSTFSSGSVINITGARAKLRTEQVHNEKYGFRKWIAIEFVSDILITTLKLPVSRTPDTTPQISYLYGIFGGTKKAHIPNFKWRNVPGDLLARLQQRRESSPGYVSEVNLPRRSDDLDIIQLEPISPVRKGDDIHLQHPA